jgi:hypothetical protein
MEWESQAIRFYDASTVFPQQMLVDCVRADSRAQGPKSERPLERFFPFTPRSEEEF